MTKQEVLEEIAEELASISDSLTEIHSELEDLSMSSKIMVFLKMMDIRPDMKEKLGPVIDELRRHGPEHGRGGRRGVRR